jgi:hypothetical protein
MATSAYHANKRQRCSLDTENPVPTQPTVTTWFPFLSPSQITQHAQLLDTYATKLKELSFKLEVPEPGIQEVISNIFAHYRYHRANCWNVYRAALLQKKREAKKQKSLVQEAPRLKQEEIYAKVFSVKMLEIQALTQLENQQAFLDLQTQTQQGNSLSITFSLGAENLRVTSIFKKMQASESFSYSYQFV